MYHTKVISPSDFIQSYCLLTLFMTAHLRLGFVQQLQYQGRRKKGRRGERKGEGEKERENGRKKEGMNGKGKREVRGVVRREGRRNFHNSHDPINPHSLLASHSLTSETTVS